MRQIIIRKGAKVRAVYCPDLGERRGFVRLARRLAVLERRATRAAGVEAVAHGFVTGRSPVTMATAHIGAAVTVSVDLRGWYDSVRVGQVAEGLRLAGVSPDTADTMAGAACRTASAPSPNADSAAPRQGLPSSPAAANLAAVAMDAEVQRGLDALGLPARAVYTRYADDMVVSVWGDDSRETVDAIIRVLTSAAEGMGWELSPTKTHIQRARAGRRVIVGVSVGDEGIAAPRATRRRLRAAVHSAPDAEQTRGLAEWCRLQAPRGVTVWQDVACILVAETDDAVLVAADRLEDSGAAGLAAWMRDHAHPEEARRAVLTAARYQLTTRQPGTSPGPLRVPRRRRRVRHPSTHYHSAPCGAPAGERT